MSLTLDASRRHVRLDPRDPAFTDDPYPAYAAIRAAAPVFFWEDYGFWCFADARRRLGAAARQALRPADPACDEPRGARLARAASPSCALRRARAPFDPGDGAARAHAAREISSIAPSSRGRWKSSRRASRRWRMSGSTPRRRRRGELIEAFATPIPVAVITDLIGVPRAMGPQLLRLVAPDGRDVPVRRDPGRRDSAPPPRRRNSPTSCAVTPSPRAPSSGTT